MALETIKKGNKIFFIGNGGSAADAQHLAAEMVVQYKTERNALPGIALTTDSSILTAASNDFGFEHVFERQLQGLARSGDLLIALSTSGNSPNILKALSFAKENGISSIGFSGKGGGEMKHYCTHTLIVPSDDTARIQEMHILMGHILCGYIESNLEH